MGKFSRARFFRWPRGAARLVVCLTMVANMAQARGAPTPAQPAPVAEWRTLDDLKRAFPHAEFRQVRPADLEKIARRYRLEGRALVALPLVQTARQEEEPEERRRKNGEQQPEEPALEPEPNLPAPELNLEPFVPRPQLHLSFQGSGDGSGGGSGKGGAVILFVVIGLFVIAFVVVASAAIVYEMVVEGKDYPGFFSLDIGFSYFNYEEDTGDGLETVEGGATMALKADFGITKPGKWGVGLGAEIGNMSGVLSVAGGESYNLTGVYGLVGPVLQFARGVIQAELLAGTNTQREVGLMSVARLRVRIPLSGYGKAATFAGPYLGLSWGTIFINLKEELGIVQDKGKFNMLWGINLGYAF
ncbi:MAG: hypothetical protein V3S29_05900 [bacterium]